MIILKKRINLKKYCDKNSNLNNELNPFINASNNTKEVDNDKIITDKIYLNNDDGINEEKR